jgi:predicted metal-dependent hydrolase
MKPRYLTDVPLPASSYVPGRCPHPAAPLHIVEKPSVAPDPARWRECRPFLYGIDSFNHGCYWEAHEVWESLWHVCGRRGPLADFLKALIQLAVVGVKLREGRGDGAQLHARRAEELLQQVAGALGAFCMGLDLAGLGRHARALQSVQPLRADRIPQPIECVVPFLLLPR